MKRFYKSITTSPDGAILLDDRAVRTPARAALALPTAALAEAVAEEWRAQGDTIDPRAMPLAGLANAAIDRVAPSHAAFAADLAKYAETDLLCYRATDDQPELVARQAAEWDPLLAWARGRYDVEFLVTSGIIHRAQPEPTLARMRQAVAAQDAFTLAALSPLVTIAGSLIVALALLEGEIAPDPAFDAAHLDELYQAELWGEDWMAEEQRAARRADFNSAARFLALLRLPASA